MTEIYQGPRPAHLPPAVRDELRSEERERLEPPLQDPWPHASDEFSASLPPPRALSADIRMTPEVKGRLGLDAAEAAFYAARQAGPQLARDEATARVAWTEGIAKAGIQLPKGGELAYEPARITDPRSPESVDHVAAFVDRWTPKGTWTNIRETSFAHFVREKTVGGYRISVARTGFSDPHIRIEKAGAPEDSRNEGQVFFGLEKGVLRAPVFHAPLPTEGTVDWGGLSHRVAAELPGIGRASFRVQPDGKLEFESIDQALGTDLRLDPSAERIPGAALTFDSGLPVRDLARHLALAAKQLGQTVGATFNGFDGDVSLIAAPGDAPKKILEPFEKLRVKEDLARQKRSARRDALRSARVDAFRSAGGEFTASPPEGMKLQWAGRQPKEGEFNHLREPVWLLTPEQLAQVPEGTELVHFDRTYTKGIDPEKSLRDGFSIRDGFTNVGFREQDLPPEARETQPTA